MFTGIIEEVGAVARTSGSEMEVLAKVVLEDVAEGVSISVDGVCLTVAAHDDERFVVETSPETLQRTTLGQLKAGDAVNLERAMAAGGRFGGHFVQGHVDGVGRVKSVQHQGEFSLWEFQAPNEISKYLVPKGSVAVDGISLTVVDPKGDTFEVAIIPETLKRTKLGSKQPGDPVNLEADLIGKHIYHFVKGGSGGLSREFLQQHGFA